MHQYVSLLYWLYLLAAAAPQPGSLPPQAPADPAQLPHSWQLDEQQMGFVSQLVTLIWLIVEQSAVEQPVQTRLGLSGVPGMGRAVPGARDELGMSSGCPKAVLGSLAAPL